MLFIHVWPPQVANCKLRIVSFGNCADHKSVLWTSDLRDASVVNLTGRKSRWKRSSCSLNLAACLQSYSQHERKLEALEKKCMPKVQFEVPGALLLLAWSSTDKD